MHTSKLTETPRRRLLRGLVAGLLLAQPAMMAFAQTANEETEKKDEEKKDVYVLDAYTVRAGFAGSLAAAAEMKQNERLIAEVVTAEDIGKLPDVSIADSLSRLPGLATQRLNGRAQAIQIRGLTGDFTTALLNGREQVSAGSNRSVEFDQYPAELLSGAIVYKTTDAALVGQGLAGTIDLRTVRPLSHGRRTIAANAFYEWTEKGALNAGVDDTGYRATFSYIDQFMDGKLGIAIGYSKANKPGQGEQWNAWGYPTVGAANDFVIGGAKPFVRSSTLERDGYMAVVQYAPTRAFESTVDVYYSKFKEDQILRGIEIPLQWSSAQLQPGYTVNNRLVTQARFNNVFGVVRNDGVFRDTDVFAAGWNLKWGDGSGWTTTADLSTSKIDREDVVLETYSGTGSNQTGPADSMLVSLTSGTGAIFTPTIDYTNPSNLRLTSPQGWGGDIVPGGQVGYLKRPTSEDELHQIRVASKRDMELGFFNSLDVGAAYTNRSKSEYENGFYMGLANNATSAPLPSSVGVTNLSFIGIPGMASYDPLAALNSGLYRLIPNPNADQIATNWEVEEDVYLGYVQFGFDKKLRSTPVRGNLGVQIVATEQASSGTSATGTGNAAVYRPVSASHDYIDILPSLNVTFEMGERSFIKLSASRQLARQRMSDMRASRQFNYDPSRANVNDPLNGPWSGNGGNTELEPWRSNSFDISIENYFAESKGYFAVSGFWKSLRNYTYNQTQIVDFTGYPFTGPQPATFLGRVDRPVNGQGGDIRGVEVTLSMASELFTKALPGFGLIVGGAYTDSSIEPFGPGSAATPIPGLSRKIYSATAYYERHGFSARVTQRYRSGYRANIYTFGPRGETFRNVLSEEVIDAQIGYTIQSGPLKNLTFLLQGYNLTDEPLFTHEGNDRRLVLDYQSYGASYSAGVSYKF